MAYEFNNKKYTISEKRTFGTKMCYMTVEEKSHELTISELVNHKFWSIVRGQYGESCLHHEKIITDRKHILNIIKSMGINIVKNDTDFAIKNIMEYSVLVRNKYFAKEVNLELTVKPKIVKK